MKILIDKQKQKVSNFINYLIENYNKKGETYNFQIFIQDKYDKRFVDKRYSELNNKLLIHHDSGFDICTKDVVKSFDKFKENVIDLANNDFIKNINNENYTKELVNYNIEIFNNERYLTLEFNFIKI